MKKFLKTYSIILYVGGLAAVATIISNLNSIPIDSQESIYPTLNWTYVNRIWILPIISFLVLFIPTLKTAKTERRVKSKVRKKILNTLMTEIFKDKKQHIRITIFKEVSYFTVLLTFIRLFFIHFYNERNTNCGYSFPSPFKTYLQVSERVGTENNKSYTFFYVDKKTQKNCEGVAAAIWQTTISHKSMEEDMLIDRLPDISNIDLENEDNWTESERKAVEDYASRTFIKDWKILRRIWIKAQHFYAIILRDELVQPVAVLIVDSITEEDFSAYDLGGLGGYVKIFSTTF